MKLTFTSTITILALFSMIIGCDFSKDDESDDYKIADICVFQDECATTQSGSPSANREQSCVQEYTDRLEDEPNFSDAIDCIHDCPLLSGCEEWNKCQVACKAEN